MDYSGMLIEDIAAQGVIKQDKNILIEAVKQLSDRINHYDIYDAISELAIIHHTAAKLGEDADNFLIVNSYECEQRLKEEIEMFVKRKPEDKTIKAMGYKEVYEPEFKYVFSF
jgi:hypothetical protein